MSQSIVIRYRTKPECAEENRRLIREVFAELAELKPDNFKYTAICLDDGVSFVHVGQHPADSNPLLELASFQRFVSTVADRCEENPVAQTGSIVGQY